MENLMSENCEDKGLVIRNSGEYDKGKGTCVKHRPRIRN